MRVLIGAAALCVMLAAAPAFAQAPAAPGGPGASGAAAPAPAPPAQRPFPAGAKYAFINIQRIAAESAEGKALAGKVQALNQQKVNELNEKNKQLQAAQQKLEAGARAESGRRGAAAEGDRAAAGGHPALHRGRAAGSDHPADSSCRTSSR